MSNTTEMYSFGSGLTPADYENLAARWITRELAESAGLRRVDSLTGKEMFNRSRGNFSGIVIPNVLPGESTVREYRLRRDSPDFSYGSDGSKHESAKYIQPPGRRNLLYFPPVPPAVLMDQSIPVIITEGEFKTLALWRLAMYQTTAPRFLPVGLAGVWNFRGTIGKTAGPNGDRCDVKGVIEDFNRLNWKRRHVILALDADTARVNVRRKSFGDLASSVDYF